MSTKHTSGPWIAGEARGTVWAGRVGKHLVAAVYGDSPDCMPDERMSANARLIAAAPELLACLQEAFRIEQARLVLADGVDEAGNQFTDAQKADAKAFLLKRRANWVHEAAAAIAKAEGAQ